MTRFQFDSISDMLMMGTHGFYVWLCFAAFTLGITGLLIVPRLKRKKLERELSLARTLERAQNS